MRALLEIESTRETDYDSEYHGDVRARLWDSLRETPYDEHGEDTPGFTFSNPFPWGGELSEGETRQLLVASPREEQLAYMTAELLDGPEMHAGDARFDVVDATPVYPDVGEEGTRGVLETATGVYAVTPDEHLPAAAESHDSETFWRPEHGVEAFRSYVERQLQRNHDRFMPSHLPGPEDVDAPLFEEYNLLKSFWVDVDFSSDVEWSVFCTKWRFPYRVRDRHHRRHLNLALDVGIGGRTPLGFGFVNDRTDEKESAELAASAAGDA